MGGGRGGKGEIGDVPINSAGDNTTSVGIALCLHEVGNVGRDCVHVECDHGACAQNGDLLFDAEALGEVVAGLNR